MMVYVTDLETTGFDNDPLAEIIEIACLEYPLLQGDLLESAGVPSGPRWVNFVELVKPERPIPAVTSAVHHITDRTVRDACSIDDVARRLFYALPDDAILVAHTAKFEAHFLNPLAAANGKTLRWICTYKLACRLFPDAPTHSNAGLFYWLGIPASDPDYWHSFFSHEQLHRAKPDAIITQYLLEKMLEKVTLDEALKISAEPALQPRCGFSKEHKGKPWSEIDEGFLKWVLHPDRDFDEDTKFTAQYWLNKAREDDEAGA